MTAPWLLLALFLMPLQTAGDVATEKPDIETISWLAGNWVCQKEKTTNHETWALLNRSAASSERVYQGLGKVITNGDENLVSRESLLIVEMEGEVFYIAKVKQNPLPVAFKLTSCSPKHAVFENAKHDFPKRLEYRLQANGKLKVTVSDGGEKGFSLLFSKKK